MDTTYSITEKDSTSTEKWKPLWPYVEAKVMEAQPSGYKPKWSNGRLICHSPLRPDKNPSFSILPDSETEPGCFRDFATGDTGSMAELARLLDVDPHATFTAKQEMVYDYVDEDGKLLFQSKRYYNAKGKKCFAQQRPNGVGGWINSLDDRDNNIYTRRVLYRLPELLAADEQEIVFLCEGEKDVDRLISLLFVATTNPLGAAKGKWRDEYSSSLAGRHVAILEDNDDTGRSHCQEVAQALAGIAASNKIIRLPGLLEHGDVSDWLDAGNTIDALQNIVDSTPTWTNENSNNLFFTGTDALPLIPDVTDPQEPEKSLLLAGPLSRSKQQETEGATSGTLPLEKITIAPLADSTNGAEKKVRIFPMIAELLDEPEEEIPWLVHNLLPSGGVSLLAAKPKCGKSTLTRNLALSVARGDSFLGRATVQAPVVYVSLEEKRSFVFGHFRRMGVTNEPIAPHVGSLEKSQIEDMATIEANILEHNAKLCIIDPMLKFVRVKDGNDYTGVQNGLSRHW